MRPAQLRANASPALSSLWHELMELNLDRGYLTNRLGRQEPLEDVVFGPLGIDLEQSHIAASKQFRHIHGGDGYNRVAAIPCRRPIGVHCYGHRA
jgi:hypothetical protein